MIPASFPCPHPPPPESPLVARVFVERWNALLRRLRRWRKRVRWARLKLNAAPPAVRVVAIVAAVLTVFSAATLFIK
jgi:hypothetical protein